MLWLMPDNLLFIGAFARRVGLTSKALRHYHEVGLLVPAGVDGSTGYRLYRPDQASRARAIRTLRELQMPLSEIANILDHPSPAQIHDLLVEHRRRVAVRHSESQIILTRLQPLIDGKEVLMDDTRSTSLDDVTRRRLAADLFNRVWTLLEAPSRTPEQDDEMVHAAHASRFHWGEIGEPVNLARGEWQCSRVYSVLGRSEPALHHAQRCLDILQRSEVKEDWDLPFAHEALARAYALAGDLQHARRHLDVAKKLLQEVADPDDRALVENDLATIVLEA
jgi:DNA-binding transcriptional MerR regulator